LLQQIFVVFGQHLAVKKRRVTSVHKQREKKTKEESLLRPIGGGLCLSSLVNTEHTIIQRENRG